jgi:hypothetical protein
MRILNVWDKLLKLLTLLTEHSLKFTDQAASTAGLLVTLQLQTAVDLDVREAVQHAVQHASMLGQAKLPVRSARMPAKRTKAERDTGFGYQPKKRKKGKQAAVKPGLGVQVGNGTAAGALATTVAAKLAAKLAITRVAKRTVASKDFNFEDQARSYDACSTTTMENDTVSTRERARSSAEMYCCEPKGPTGESTSAVVAGPHGFLQRCAFGGSTRQGAGPCVCEGDTVYLLAA